MEDVRNALKMDEASIIRRQVMVVGGIGVGKTLQFLTLPGKKFAYLFDPNAVEAIKGHDVDYIEFLPEITDLDLSIKTLKKDTFDKTTRKIEPRTYLNWEVDFEERLSSGFFKDYEWVMFDSATTFSEIVMDRVQFLNNRLGKQPEQADWAAEMNSMKNIFRAASSAVRCYLTVHIETARDELTGKVSGKLLLTGRGRTRIPLRFGNIFGLKTDTNAQSEPVYYARTFPDREFNTVRTAIKGLAPEENITLDLTKPYEGQGLGRILKGA